MLPPPTGAPMPYNPGGRIRHDSTFVDFPISLGGEWLHVAPDVLDELTDGGEANIELAEYTEADEGPIVGEEFQPFDLGDWEDLKFVGTSWFGVFEELVLPRIGHTIETGVRVVEIDASGERVRLLDAAGGEHRADAVVCTIPLAVLQGGDVRFVPPLPEAMMEAIDAAPIWTGIKVFIEFSERFYPSAVLFPDSVTVDGQRLFYDAAHGQDSDHHVLGLFAVGAQAEAYQAMGDGLLEGVLDELDGIFDGAASPAYVGHRVQDWGAEPLAGGKAYLADIADSEVSTTLAQRFSDQLVFAGDAFTSFDDWSSVHTAVRSAIEAVEFLVD